MKHLIIMLLSFPLFSQAQTFYVTGKDRKSTDYIVEKIKFEGYKISEDSTAANYTVHLLVDGSYKVVSMRRPYKGYVNIVNNNSGEEVVRSVLVKGSPTAFNGYNASWSIFTTIAKKYLPEMLRKCK